MHNNENLVCGHHKSNLWVESFAGAQSYCVVCSLHEELDLSKKEVEKWRNAVEDALGLERDDENHTPEWAQEIILVIREIGNKK